LIETADACIVDVLGIKMKISFEKTEDCLVGEPVNSSNEENPVCPVFVERITNPLFIL
jgi:hypothetical protein